MTKLDVLIVPTEASERNIRSKAQKAVDIYRSNSDVRTIVISGGKMPFLPRGYLHEAHIAYEVLRASDIRPRSIVVDGRSTDTVENILYSFAKLEMREEREQRNYRDVGIVSYPGHLDRFELIVEQAKREGLIAQDVRIHRIEMPQSWFQTAWEVLGRMATKKKLKRGLDALRDVPPAEIGFGKRMIYWMAKKLS